MRIGERVQSITCLIFGSFVTEKISLGMYVMAGGDEFRGKVPLNMTEMYMKNKACIVHTWILPRLTFTAYGEPRRMNRSMQVKHSHFIFHNETHAVQVCLKVP